MKRKLLIVVLALALVLLPAAEVFADTSDDITVTATPAFISISVLPATYDIGGAGATLDKATTYYANPLGETTPPSSTVLDTECAFTITNLSSVATDVTVNFPDFTGGDACLNSDLGYTVAGAGEFGVSGYASGSTWTSGAVIFKTTASVVFIDALAATTDIKFGWAFLTQSDDWTSGTGMESTVNVAMVAD